MGRDHPDTLNHSTLACLGQNQLEELPRSWLNQIEIWFGILVRKLLRRASFTSQTDLKAKILAFIESFKHTIVWRGAIDYGA